MSAPLFPHEIRPEPVVLHRIEGTRGQAHRLLGVADSEHVEQAVTAFRAAMRGWRITTHEERYVRRVVGAADHDRHEAGRGKEDHDL